MIGVWGNEGRLLAFSFYIFIKKYQFQEGIQIRM